MVTNDYSRKADLYGWESAIRGMLNPMNSWDKTDSLACYYNREKYAWIGRKTELEILEESKETLNDKQFKLWFELKERDNKND